MVEKQSTAYPPSLQEPKTTPKKNVYKYLHVGTYAYNTVVNAAKSKLIQIKRLIFLSVFHFEFNPVFFCLYVSGCECVGVSRTIC